MPLPEGSNIVVSFLETQQEGSTFERTADGEGWPQHITVVPWFTMPELSEQAVVSALDEGARTHPAFSVMVGREELFGPKNNVRVSVIETSKECHGLHLDVAQALGASGAVFVNRAYMGENYHPHITHNNGTPPRQGDVIHLRELSLVRLLGEKTCQVIRNFPLESRQ